MNVTTSIRRGAEVVAIASLSHTSYIILKSEASLEHPQAPTSTDKTRDTKTKPTTSKDEN